MISSAHPPYFDWKVVWTLGSSLVWQRNPSSIPSNLTYNKATALVDSDLGKVSLASTLIHELGHFADKQFGANASRLVNDVGKTNKETDRLQKQNRQTMKECKEYLKKLAKN